MFTRIITSYWTFAVSFILVTAFIYSMVLAAKPEMSRSLIESFAHQQINKQLSNFDYAYFDSQMVIDTGYDNRHAVSGTGSAIRFGRGENNGTPMTEFHKIRYVVIVKVLCGKWYKGDCLAVRGMKIMNDRTKRPLI